MEEDIKRALETDRTIDITTTGRKSGKPRRVEIWFYNLEGRIYITGLPRTRDWYANLKGNPEFTFHLKRSVRADLPARAIFIEDEERRRELQRLLFPHLADGELEARVAGSPLIEVELEI